MKSLLATTSAIAALFWALPASAQFQKPEDAVKYRRAGMTMMSTHLGRIGTMASGRAPYDAAAAQANADVLVMLSTLPYAGFVDGTAGTEKGTAKSNIWTERAKFDEAAKKMQDAVAKLAVAAKSNNLDTLKAAVGPAGGACKSCHDDFRNP
jgi:cytochrome c556